MKKLHLLSFLLLCLSVNLAKAQTTFAIDFLNYEILNSEEVAVKGYLTTFVGAVKQTVIPETVEYKGNIYKVVSVVNGAFSNRSDIEVVLPLPSTIRSIGNNAFLYNNMQGELVLPEQLEEVGESAFKGCYNIKSVEIPQSLKKLGRDAFSYMRDLRSFVFRAKQLESNGTGLFYMSSDGAILDIVVGKEAESVPDYFFQSVNQCSLSFEEGSNCKQIGANAFSQVGVHGKVTFPERLESIGYNAFSWITTPFEIEFQGTSLKTVGASAFEKSTGLGGSVMLPSSVEEIGNAAFSECSGITGTMSLPLSLGKINSYILRDCINVSALEYNCANITDKVSNVFSNFGVEGFDVIIGKDVKNIPASLFSGSNAKFLTFAEGCVCTEIGASAFRGTSIVGKLNLPKHLQSIGYSAFENVSTIEDIRIEENVTDIGGSAFSGCTGVKELYFDSPFDNFGSGRTAIKPFVNVAKESGGMRLTIGKHVKKIYANEFNESYPVSIVFEDGSICSEIESSAFCVPTLGGEVALPETMKIVGSSAFYGTSISEVYVPENLERIGKDAFSGCKQLKKVVWNAVKLQIDGRAFDGSGKDKGYELVIGCKVTEIGDGLFYTSSQGSLEEGKFNSYASGPNSITWEAVSMVNRIGEDAFAGCILLTDLDIPSSVAKIGNRAFFGCSGLTDLSLLNHIETLGTGSFEGCYGLKKVYYDLTGNDNACPFGQIVDNENTRNSNFELTLGSHVKNLTDYLFENAPIDTLIFEPGIRIESIGRKVFADCRNMKGHLLFTAALRKVGEYAFENCTSLNTPLYLPSSLEEFSLNAFHNVRCYDMYVNTPLALPGIGNILNGKLTIGASIIKIEDKHFMDATITSLEFEDGSKLKEIGEKAFYGAIKGGKLDLPECLEKIGKSAFENGEFEGKMRLPKQLETIGEAAFMNCKKLVGNMNIDSKLSIVDDKAFSGCEGLYGELTLPGTLTKVGWDAFAGTSFTSVRIEEGETPLEFGDNFNATGNWIIRAPVPSSKAPVVMSSLSVVTGQFAKAPIREAYVNRDIKYLCGATMNLSFVRHYYSPFGNSENLEKVVIGDAVSHISPYEFAYCKNLSTVELPMHGSCLVSIDMGAFDRDSSLVDINVPASVSTIGSTAFQSCVSLQRAEICTAKVTRGADASAGGGTDIGGYAFYGCKELQEVVLGPAVTKIGSYAFGYCDALSIVACLSPQPPLVDLESFSNTNAQSCKLQVPANSKNDYRTTMVWQDFMIEDIPAAILPVNAYNAGDGAQYFDLKGNRVPHNMKGVVIIKNGDGSVEKVLRR